MMAANALFEGEYLGWEVSLPVTSSYLMSCIGKIDGVLLTLVCDVAPVDGNSVLCVVLLLYIRVVPVLISTYVFFIF